jgi:hypothetical protein
LCPQLLSPTPSEFASVSGSNPDFDRSHVDILGDRIRRFGVDDAAPQVDTPRFRREPEASAGARHGPIAETATACVQQPGCSTARA